jgi:cobalamin biosynthetic protein CobC
MRLNDETELALDLSRQGLVIAGESHGGDLSAARQKFPRAPEPWLDLSTGVNPYRYPFSPPPAESWTCLPDFAALAALERSAAAAYRASAHANVVAAPGTQAIINWLPHLFPARRVAILGFTYFDHFAAWRAAGAATTIVEDLAEFEDKDVGVIVNPNNPDGRIVPLEELRALAEDFRQRGKLLIIDEAFVDFCGPGVSLAPHLPPSGALILRSFGKVFGLPGLRLGFALAPAGMAAKLRAALGCWPVSGAAIAIGLEALSDSSWLRVMREKLSAGASELDAILQAAGFELRGAAPLFRLAAAPDAQQRFEALAKAGVWVRRFDARPNWLRFAIPGSAMDQKRLRLALGAARPDP